MSERNLEVSNNNGAQDFNWDNLNTEQRRAVKSFVDYIATEILRKADKLSEEQIEQVTALIRQAGFRW